MIFKICMTFFDYTMSVVFGEMFFFFFFYEPLILYSIGLESEKIRIYRN
jgi:hypothetical protein